MSHNPFKSNGNPYRSNPFVLLGVTPDIGQAVIEEFADAREAELVAGLQPLPDLELRPGDCKQAAQHLQDPVLRLAFDLMLRWSGLEDEEPS